MPSQSNLIKLVGPANFNLSAYVNEYKYVNLERINLECDVTAGAVNIAMPAIEDLAGFLNFNVVVDITVGTAQTNPVTISCDAADDINGSATLVLDTDYQKAMLAIAGSNEWVGLTTPSRGPQALGYKTYVALLNQDATAAPTANVLQNTIGTIVWTRTGAGDYLGTLTGAFPQYKTWVVLATYIDTFSDVFWLSANTLQLKTNNSANVGTDSLLMKRSIEIRVYP